MEAVSVETLSETGVSMSNPELIDSQEKKKRSGKKKKKSRKLDDPHLTNHNDEAYQNPLSMLPAESSSRHSVSNAEPGATLHHTVPVSSTTKNALPESSKNGSSRKKSRSREKKKKDTSSDEKIVDDAETTIYEDLGLPPRNSCQKSAATDMSQKKKRKKERDRNRLKENDVDIHCTIAELAAKCNTLSGAEGSKSMSIEETVSQIQSSKAKKRKKKSPETIEVYDPLSTLGTSLQSGTVGYSKNNDPNAGREVMSNLAGQRENSATGEESSFKNPGKAKKKETDENNEVNEDSVAEIACDARSKKQKGKKKKTSYADMEVCDHSKSTFLASVESGSAECLLDHSNKEDLENGYGNAGQEFAGKASTRKSQRSARREKNVLTDNDSLLTNQIGKADEAAPSLEKVVVGNEKSTSEDQVLLSENSLSTLPVKSCQQDSVSCEEPGAALHHTVPVFSTREDLVLDASRNDSSRKRSRSREKKKEDISCEEAEITTKEDQVLPPKNPSSNGMIQEGSGQHTQKLCENPAATNMICSQKRKRKKKRDRNTMKEGGVDIHCSKAEVATEYNSISEAEGSKSMGVEENVPQTQSPKAKKRKKRKTKTMEVCDPLGDTLTTCMHGEPVECREDNDLNAGRGLMSNLASKRENSANGEESSFQNLGKTKKKETDVNTVVDDDVVGADVGDLKRKKQRGKKKKTSSADQEAADLEVCDPSRSTLLATAESESKECLLDHSNREDTDNCDGNAGQEFVGEAMTSKSENPVAREKSEEKKELKDTVYNQNAFGAEAVSEVEVNAKKRKNSLDKKTDNREEEKGEVSIPRNDEEPKFDRETPETSLSSSVLIHNNVAQRVASPETGLDRCSCRGQSSRKLLVLDLNGILVDVVQGNTGRFVPDGRVSSRKIFRRPFVASFLDFCFERFDVGIWSSRRIGLDYMIKVVMKYHAKNLLFCFDQHMCTETKFSSQESRSKPLFLKDLRRVWDRYETCFSCEKRKYDETNTLLIDDSAHKSMCNPPYTAIFPRSYNYTHFRDSALGPEGELRTYLARLADAENVQKFVKENPFGQPAITEAHGSWEYYSKSIEAQNSCSEERIRTRQRTNKNSLFMDYDNAAPVHDDGYCSAMVWSQVAAEGRTMTYFRDLEFPDSYAEMSQAQFLLASRQNRLVLDYEEKVFLQAGALIKKQEARKKVEAELAEAKKQLGDLAMKSAERDERRQGVMQELGREKKRLRVSRAAEVARVKGALTASFTGQLDVIKRKIAEKASFDGIKAEKEQAEALLGCFDVLESIDILVPAEVRGGVEASITKYSQDLENLQFEPLPDSLFEVADVAAT